MTRDRIMWDLAREWREKERLMWSVAGEWEKRKRRDNEVWKMAVKWNKINWGKTWKWRKVEMVKMAAETTARLWLLRVIDGERKLKVTDKKTPEKTINYVQGAEEETQMLPADVRKFEKDEMICVAFNEWLKREKWWQGLTRCWTGWWNMYERWEATRDKM